MEEEPALDESMKSEVGASAPLATFSLPTSIENEQEVAKRRAVETTSSHIRLVLRNHHNKLAEWLFVGGGGKLFDVVSAWKDNLPGYKEQIDRRRTEVFASLNPLPSLRRQYSSVLKRELHDSSLLHGDSRLLEEGDESNLGSPYLESPSLSAPGSPSSSDGAFGGIGQKRKRGGSTLASVTSSVTIREAEDASNAHVNGAPSASLNGTPIPRSPQVREPSSVFPLGGSLPSTPVTPSLPNVNLSSSLNTGTPSTPSSPARLSGKRDTRLSTMSTRSSSQPRLGTRSSSTASQIGDVVRQTSVNNGSTTSPQDLTSTLSPLTVSVDGAPKMASLHTSTSLSDRQDAASNSSTPVSTPSTHSKKKKGSLSASSGPDGTPKPTSSSDSSSVVHVTTTPNTISGEKVEETSAVLTRNRSRSLLSEDEMRSPSSVVVHHRTVTRLFSFDDPAQAEPLQGEGDGVLSSVNDLASQHEKDVRERVAELKKQHLWSEKRLPRVAEPPRTKVHWDYLLEEMAWLANDFKMEQKWKTGAAKKLAKAAVKYHEDKASEVERAQRLDLARKKRVAGNISREVSKHWKQMREVVSYKHKLEVDILRKEALDRHLDLFVGHTELLTARLTQGWEEARADGVSLNGKQATDKQSEISKMADDPSLPPSQPLLLTDTDSNLLQSTLPASMVSTSLIHPIESAAKKEHTEEKVVQPLSQENDPEKKEDHEQAEGKQERDEDEGKDADFDPRAMIDIDDESTIKAIDEPTNAKEEVDALKNEGEMTLEELLAMYPGYGGGHSDDEDDDEEGSNGGRSSPSSSDEEDFDSYETEESEDNDEDDDGEATLDPTLNTDEGSCVGNDDEVQRMKDDTPAPPSTPGRRGRKPLASKDKGGIKGDSTKEPTSQKDNEDRTDQMHSSSTFSSSLLPSSSSYLAPSSNQNQDGGGVDENSMVVDVSETMTLTSTREGSTPEDVQKTAERLSAIQPEGVTPSPSRVHTTVPFLLKGSLRPYQHVGLDWLVNLHKRRLNGILADEMGLGKTIQTISFLAYLACEEGNWGPHLIVVPTSVILNWEMEFKRWCPALKVQTYYGGASQRKALRHDWGVENGMHVCITSYQIVLQDQGAFRRKKWRYLILDEAHNIKNFATKRWQTLLCLNTTRRLLLTGTPLQNSLMELWSLMHFLMPSVFHSHSQFKEWFDQPVSEMAEGVQRTREQERRDHERVLRLHKILRPFLLRRLKSEVEQQMPSKTEEVVTCPLSARQRLLYDDFLERSQTRQLLAAGSYVQVVNVLMQLRKVCNHPNLFADPHVGSPFVLSPLAYHIPLLCALPLTYKPVSLCTSSDEEFLSLRLYNLCLLHNEVHGFASYEMSSLKVVSEETIASLPLPVGAETLRPSFPPTPEGISDEVLEGVIMTREENQRSILKRYAAANNLYRSVFALYGHRLRALLDVYIDPYEEILSSGTDAAHELILDHAALNTMFCSKFAISTITAIAQPPRLYVSGRAYSRTQRGQRAYSAPLSQLEFASLSSREYVESNLAAVRLLDMPDPRLIQYNCGKLQVLASMLVKLKHGGHRVLIFTQMSKMLDVLEQFLTYHGHTYLRLDGSTPITTRQQYMEVFNNDKRYFCFILSTRSGGIGMNLTGADTVVFYDSDWNPTMDAQAQDRCHRIGQTRDVHIFRLISEHTVEENILKKANQKRMIGQIAIEGGNFSTDFFNKHNWKEIFGLQDQDGDAEDALSSSHPTSLSSSSSSTRRPLGTPSLKQIELMMENAEDETDRQAAAELRLEQSSLLLDFDESRVGQGSGATKKDLSSGLRRPSVPSSDLGGEPASSLAVNVPEQEDDLSDLENFTSIKPAPMLPVEEDDIPHATTLDEEAAESIQPYDPASDRPMVVPASSGVGRTLEEDDEVLDPRVELEQQLERLRDIEKHSLVVLERYTQSTHEAKLKEVQEEIDRKNEEIRDFQERLRGRQALVQEDEEQMFYDKEEAYRIYFTASNGHVFTYTPPIVSADIYVEPAHAAQYQVSYMRFYPILPNVSLLSLQKHGKRKRDKENVQKKKLKAGVSSADHVQTAPTSDAPTPRPLLSRTVIDTSPLLSLFRKISDPKLAKTAARPKPPKASRSALNDSNQFAPEWLADEDRALYHASTTFLSTNGSINWSIVADHVNLTACTGYLRSRVQCQDRYFNFLRLQEDGKPLEKGDKEKGEKDKEKEPETPSTPNANGSETPSKDKKRTKKAKVLSPPSSPSASKQTPTKKMSIEKILKSDTKRRSVADLHTYAFEAAEKFLKARKPFIFKAPDTAAQNLKVLKDVSKTPSIFSQEREERERLLQSQQNDPSKFGLSMSSMSAGPHSLGAPTPRMFNPAYGGMGGLPQASMFLTPTSSQTSSHLGVPGAPSFGMGSQPFGLSPGNNPAPRGTTPQPLAAAPQPRGSGVFNMPPLPAQTPAFPVGSPQPNLQGSSTPFSPPQAQPHPTSSTPSSSSPLPMVPGTLPTPPTTTTTSSSSSSSSSSSVGVGAPVTRPSLEQLSRVIMLHFSKIPKVMAMVKEISEQPEERRHDMMWSLYQRLLMHQKKAAAEKKP